MSDFGPRLGSISPEQFQQALERFDLGHFTGARPAREGMSGQNVFVTSTEGEWVLRGRPHYPRQFAKERFFSRLIHERTPVPAPWPYLLDPKTDIFGWSYVIMPRLPGVQIIDPAVRDSLDPEDPRLIYDALGTGLAEVHRLVWDFPGECALESDAIEPLTESWPEWIENGILRRLQQSRSYNNHTTDLDVAWVGEILNRGRTALSEPFTPCCVLHDYSAYNSVVRHDEKGWRLSGVFDLMEAFMGDGEMDLCRQIGLLLKEDPDLVRAFVQAYLRAAPARPGFEERFPIYMLDERLVIWEYGQRESTNWWWPSGTTLREWAQPYVSFTPY